MLKEKLFKGFAGQAGMNAEASSTERLLQVIRGQDSAAPQAGADRSPEAADSGDATVQAGPLATSSAPNTCKPVSRLARPWGKRSGVRLGVEICPSELRLVLVSGPGARVLLAHKLPYPEGITPTSLNFWQFLKGAIEARAGDFRNLEVWTTLPSNRVDVWSLRVPVTAAKDQPNAIYWSAKREKQFDESQVVFDYEVHGLVKEKDQQRLSVTAYTASRTEVDALKDLFRSAGFPLTGITPQPFTVQTLRRVVSPAPSDCFGNLQVGPEWTRIDIYLGRNLILSREFKSGFNTVQETLQAEYNARNPSEKTLSWPGETPAQDASSEMTAQQAGAVLDYFAQSGPSPASGPGNGLDPAAILQLARDALERLARQIERTFAHVQSTHGEGVSGFWLGGRLGNRPELLQFFSEQTGVPAKAPDPLQELGGCQMPDGQGVSLQGEPLTMVLGLALSDPSQTPNLLQTYREKLAVNRSNLVVRYTAVACLVAVLAVSAVGWFVNNRANAVRMQAEEVNRQLTMCGPLVEAQSVTQLAEQVVKGAESYREYSQRLRTVAALGEVLRLTPDDIRLLSIRMSDSGQTVRAQPVKGPPAKDQAGKDPAAQPQSARIYQIMVDGIVLGNKGAMETALTSFLAQLGSSPVFANSTIVKNEGEQFGPEGRVQHFVISLTTI